MKYNIVGQSVPRIDARAKVTGEAPYPGDFVMDGMLHMKLLFAGRPHARVLSINTKTAEALPGVVAVFTAKDVPVNEKSEAFITQTTLTSEMHLEITTGEKGAESLQSGGEIERGGLFAGHPAHFRQWQAALVFFEFLAVVGHYLVQNHPAPMKSGSG